MCVRSATRLWKIAIPEPIAIHSRIDADARVPADTERAWQQFVYHLLLDLPHLFAARLESLF
jgi:hypothetical protein